jgi:hypothetical protein
MSWTDNLKGYPLNWLLKPSDPSVRFWALQQLLDRPLDAPDVRDAQDAVMESHPVRAILDAQSPEGHWGNPEDMYNPKYRATTHCLLVLAELGSKRTPAIERGIEHVFDFQRDSGHFFMGKPKTRRGYASKVTDGCCLDANVLHYLNHFGYMDDPHTQKTIRFLLDDHASEEGGWKCRAYPIDPAKVFASNCFMGAAKVLRTFAAIPSKQRSSEMNAVIDREVESVLENGVYRYLRNPDGSRKDKAGWKRFGFPLFYQSDALEVLDALTRLGVRDPRMEPAINLILDAQQGDGSWLLKHTFNGKMWADIDVKHEPSKWITLRALRVLKRYHG